MNIGEIFEEESFENNILIVRLWDVCLISAMWAGTGRRQSCKLWVSSITKTIVDFIKISLKAY